MAYVRYLVGDVPRAVDFYVTHLGFTRKDSFGAAFASVVRDDLELWLAGPGSSAARPMDDGAQPGPGGWARLVLHVDDLAATVAAMRANGVRFRSGIVTGPGGKQIVCDDPSGNPIELFEAAR